MTDRRVIRWIDLPSRPPLFPTLTLWLLLDRLQPNPVVIGVVWTLWALICLYICVATWCQKPTSIAWKDAP